MRDNIYSHQIKTVSNHDLPRNSIETQRRNRARAIESETGQRDKKKNEGGTEPKTVRTKNVVFLFHNWVLVCFNYVDL